MESVKSCGIIGFGRLGKTLASMIDAHMPHRKLKIYTRTPQLNCNYARYFVAFEEITKVDILFITVPDDTIETIVHRLTLKCNFAPGSIVAHCSGALSSDVLLPLKNCSINVASLHPLASFSGDMTDLKFLNSLYWSIEGDKKAIQILTNFITEFSGSVFEIDKHKKTLYHAACALASNYIPILYQLAYDCFLQAQVDQELIKSIVCALMKIPIERLGYMSPQSVLTGPIVRLDKNTIDAHCKVLGNDKLKLAVYELLGKATEHVILKRGTEKNIFSIT